MAFCTKCGVLLEEGEKFCGKCGAPAEQQMIGKRCGVCGNLIEEELSFCSFCGADLSESSPAEEVTSNAAERTEQSATDRTISKISADSPEQELYSRNKVSLFSSILQPVGTLTITTHRLLFQPSKLFRTAKPIEIPISQIQSSETKKVLIAIPGSIKVISKDGKKYTFTFGAMYTSEAAKAAEVLHKVLKE